MPIAIVVAVMVAMAAFPHLFELMTASLGLGAPFAVARNLPVEVRFGLADAPFAPEVSIATAAFPHLFKLMTASLGLRAPFAVARNLLVEVRFGLADALFALVLAILGACSRGACEQQDPA